MTAPSPSRAEAAAPAPPAPRTLARIAGAAATFLTVAALLQLLTPAPWDADTAYHVAVGRLVARHGILTEFPWTPFSWLATHYADKELLFHLLLAPLAGLGWIAAAKLAGTVLGGGLLLALYLVLRAEKVERASLWALFPLAASAAFVVRFAVVRPHLVSVALAIVVLWAALRERHLAVAAVSLAYPWTYVAWHLPLVLVAIAEGARTLAGGRPRWRPAAAALLGIAAGVALHPNALNLLGLWRIVHVDILLRGAWGALAGVELGREFRPFGAEDAVRLLLVPGAATVTAGWLAWRDRRRDALALAFACGAAAFGLLTLRSQRFVEYFAPFAAAAIALAARDQARRWAAPALGAAFAFTAALAARPVLALGTRGDDVPPVFMTFLQERIPPDAQVFTCEWGLTGELMLALPGRRLIVALDPMLFHALDPELYRVWYALPRTGPPDAAQVIRDRFGARYVLCLAGRGNEPLLARLDGDPSVQPLLRSRLWMVYDLGGASPPR